MAQGAVDEVEIDYDYSVLIKLDDGTYFNSDDWQTYGRRRRPHHQKQMTSVRAFETSLRCPARH